MMKALIASSLVLVFLLAGVVPAFAEDLTDVNEIVKKANHAAYYQGTDGRARVRMTIADTQGREREREFTILRRNMDDQDGEQNFYVYFYQPPDVRDMVFMVHKHVGADDDRWLYLPALDVVKRIAASDKRTSFVGSHFFYEDVSGRGLDQDTHELVKTTDNYYVVKNVPKDPGSVEFDSYTMYIHKTSFLPVTIEYEKGGQVYRTGKALEVKDVQGFPTVVKAEMSDSKIGGKTTMEYTSVEYNVGLPADLFSERYMRKAPREWLK